MHDAGASVLRLAERAGDPAMSARMADWLLRHDEAAAGAGARVPWLAAVSLIAVGLLWMATRDRR
jgi:hypothetical protein